MTVTGTHSRRKWQLPVEEDLRGDMTKCPWELRQRQESEGTPAFQLEGLDQSCPRIMKGNKVVGEGADFSKE